MFVRVNHNRICSVYKEVASFLLKESYFSTCRRIIVICFIDDFGAMLTSVEVTKVLSSVTFLSIGKKVMDAVSQGLLFLNTQENTIVMIGEKNDCN